MISTTDVNTQLLIENARFDSSARVFVLSAADPMLPIYTAKNAGTVDVFDIHYTALDRVAKQISARKAENVRVSEDGLPLPDQNYDAGLMVVPKGRDFARMQLWAALRSLKPGGRLYIAGANAGGAKSTFDDAAQLFGRCVTLTTKKSHRVGVAVRPETVPDYPWEGDPGEMREVVFYTPWGQFPVATMPGVFSWEHLDEGTAFLLDNIQFEKGQTVLDVGCGNGIIGAMAAITAESVTMVDDNLLAVRCARETLNLIGVANACAIPGDVYANLQDQRFDLIISNPPFHQEFDVNTNVAHRLMRGAKKMLRPGGRIVIVANAFLKYEQVMAESMPHSRVLARNNRFVVIEGSL